MTVPEAKALIDRQRRRWHSQATDDAIARRVQRSCLGLASVYLVLGISCAVGLHSISSRVMGGAAFLGVGALFFWNSRRFARIRRLLAAENTAG